MLETEIVYMNVNVSFNEFLEKFPVIDLPVSLTNESHFEFSKHNDILPASFVEQWILPNDNVIDEFTEFIPCFRLPGNENFQAVVYWKAGLLSYEYYLVTYNKNGELIARQLIAGLKSNTETVLQRLAVIDEELIISIVEGNSQTQNSYNPENTKTYHMEILPSGDIIYAVG